jgi:hypothetical protein
MKSDLYRLNQKYRGAPTKKSAYAKGGSVRRHFDGGGLNDMTGDGGDGSGQADPNGGAGEDTVADGASPPAGPPPARVTVPSGSGNRTMDLESLLQRYATPTTNYGAQLAQAQQAARSETEAFSNAVRQMAERTESPTSRAEMYFRLAAAFGAPTKTGKFAENLSLVGKEMSEYAKGRRTEEADRRTLGLRAQELRMTGARQDLASLQTLAGQEAAERRAINSKVIEAYLRGNQPSARETRINDMMSTYNVDRATASRIVDNVDSVVADPVSGTPQLVNRITGEARPVTAVGPSLAGPPAAAPTTAAPTTAAPAAAGSGTAAPSAGPPNASTTAAPAAEQPRRTLWQMAPDVTGLVPALQETAQGVTGQVGVNVAPSGLVRDRQTFANAQGELIRSLSNNPQFPVREMERIRQEVSISPGAMTDERSLRERMRSVDTYLRERLENQQRAGQDTSLPVETRRAARKAAEDIRNFLSILGVPRQNEEPASPPPRQDTRRRPAANNTQIPRVGQVVDGYTFLGGDPSDQKNWSRE